MVTKTTSQGDQEAKRLEWEARWTRETTFILDHCLFYREALGGLDKLLDLALKWEIEGDIAGRITDFLGKNFRKNETPFTPPTPGEIESARASLTEEDRRVIRATGVSEERFIETRAEEIRGTEDTEGKLCEDSDGIHFVKEPLATAEEEALGIEVHEVTSEEIPSGLATPARVLKSVPHAKFRFPTGIPSLDEATRGGLPTGIVFGIFGWPDAGKTGLGTQIAVKIALEHEAVVVIFAPDAGQEPVAVRIGGLLGLDQDKLDARDPKEERKLQKALQAHRLFIVDYTREGMVLEAVFNEMQACRPDLPHVYLVDSIQESLATEKADDLGERERAIAVMRLARRAVTNSTTPTLAIVTSQVTGAAFAPRKAGDRVHPLGAPAESKKISFLCDLILSLEGDPSKSPEYGRAAVTKSKLRGPKPSFSLRVDPVSSRLSEVPAEEIEAAQQEIKSKEAEDRVSKLADRILKTLQRHGPLNVSTIRERVKGNHDKILGALDLLEKEGRASWEKGAKNSRVWKAKESREPGPVSADPDGVSF